MKGSPNSPRVLWSTLRPAESRSLHLHLSGTIPGQPLASLSPPPPASPRANHGCQWIVTSDRPQPVRWLHPEPEVGQGHQDHRGRGRSCLKSSPGTAGGRKFSDGGYLKVSGRWVLRVIPYGALSPLPASCHPLPTPGPGPTVVPTRLSGLGHLLTSPTLGTEAMTLLPVLRGVSRSPRKR